MKNLLFLGLMYFFVNNASATNYYFSDALGDDNRTNVQAQNQATPWKSLNKLNSFFVNIRPGDSILFKRGDTFYGSINVSQSGSSSSPIVFSAYGSGIKPNITGFVTPTGWTQIKPYIWESLPISTTLTDIDVLTINNIFQSPARFPNTGYITFQSHSGGNSVTASGLPLSLIHI